METPNVDGRVAPESARVAWADGGVVVRDEAVLGAWADAPTRQFLERAFQLAEVGSIAVDRTRSTAVVRPVHTPADPTAFLARLAEALRDGRRPVVSLPRGVRELRFTVHRHGGLLSTCEVVVDQPGRLRIRHPSLRSDPLLARRFVELMASLPGVAQTALDARTGAVTLRYDHGAVTTPRLIRLSEEALDATSWWDRAVPPPPRTSFALANANLAVGAAADLAVSALAPVSALILVGTNLRTFKLAGSQLRRRRPGLPVLYTVIVGGTLISGQFLASALMSWSFKFWQHRLRRDLSSERRRSLDAFLPVPRLARLDAPAGEVLGPVDRLRVGDQVLVGAGDRIPADGRVMSGEAVVDEQALRGRTGVSLVRTGDRVLASTEVLEGALCIKVSRAAECTRASHVGRALLAATSPTPGLATPTRRAEAYADRAVVPTMAAAGVGLLAGDLGTAVAILRPDYATGPGVMVPLETVRDAVACARRGIVIRSPEVFDRLARIDEIVVEDAPGLLTSGLEVVCVGTRLPEALVLRYAASAFRHLADDRAEALIDACRDRRCHLLDLPAVEYGDGVTVVHDGRRVRVREAGPGLEAAGPLAVEVDGQTVGILEFGLSAAPKASRVLGRWSDQPGVAVVLLSHRPEPEASAAAARLGVAEVRAGLSDEDKAAYLLDRRDQGVKTVFVGDCRARPDLVSAAGLAISTSGEVNIRRDPADVVLLRPDLELVDHLREVARTHAKRVRTVQRFVILPNALCVAGAFLFGVTALTVVVVSNLTTLGIYRRTTGALHALAAPGRARPQRRLAAKPIGT